MSRGPRILLRVALGLLALLVIVVATGYYLLQTQWFFDKVRVKLIAVVETATGGRVEIGAFSFDRAHFRVEVRDFVLHGTEPAGKNPLFRAARVTVGLKLVSLIKRSVDISSLDVVDPQVYLMIGPDGRTNVPEPKVKSTSNRSPIESILDLKIGSFRLQNGSFEVESQSRTPFNIVGRNLTVQLGYEAAGPRYRGTIAMDPLDVKAGEGARQPLAVNLGLLLERNRIQVDNGHVTTAQTKIDFDGTMLDLAGTPHAQFKYEARTEAADVARILGVPELRHGTAVVKGSGTWSAQAGVVLTGRLNGTGLEYRDASVQFVDSRAEGAFTLGSAGLELTGLRLATHYARAGRREPIEGGIAKLEIRGGDLEGSGIALGLLGGTFHGRFSLRELHRYTVSGDIAGIQAMRTVSMYSTGKLPWDALVDGKVQADGSFRDSRALKATANLTLAPAPKSAPVRGQVTANYDARAGVLDLGRSSVTLPHSRVDFSGAIGRELRAHLETSDLNDLLPALGDAAAALPVKLNNGTVVFDGTVTGNLNTPRMSGHLRATHAEYAGEAVDSLEADLTAAPEMLRIQNGAVTRGTLAAQVQGSIVLSNWTTSDASPISATVTVRNAPLVDALAIANAKDTGATGTLTATIIASGTLGAPRAAGDIEVVKGAYRGEAFDRVATHLAYAGDMIELTNAEIVAGPKQVKGSATYVHAPNRFDAGRLKFQVSTNTFGLDQIQTLTATRAGVRGTVQATAGGEVEIDAKAKAVFRIGTLDADLTAKGLALEAQPIGDAHLTAHTQIDALRAHLESTAAGSSITGDGEWKLEGDVPGKATVAFTKLDLANLRAWISPGSPLPIAGSLEGEFRVEGPALDWKAMRAELRIPSLETRPAPGTSVVVGDLGVKNSGPIVLRYEKNVLTVESAHLVGKGTDLTVTGRIATDQKSPLDLRVDGHADLAIISDFVSDVVASGTVATNATVRGALSDPQINGRMEFQKAAFSVADVPNGISNASGVLLFNKDRATIQSLTGETGGGKVEIAGFVGYGSGGPLLFRLHARAHEVRVRYPEGVSTVADADLSLTGTEERSTLTGDVTILRTGVNLQSDFSSILAGSAQPVRTPSTQPGLLGGMAFEVSIATSPEVQFQSSLTENLQVEANLRLRGTVTNPALLGRITITKGKLTFFGTQYTLNQGTISFYNPVRVEPILSIDLETKVRGIEVTLTVSGPLNKLSLTPRSDPPLQFNEIVALLAQGRAPASDPLLVRQQTAEPQSWQQAGASAVLGSAIANPVAGRLQRFFGVSKLRIDPSLSGIENNPQARLTLEQQVTPNVTFTYITNVTNSNPQVVRVEWAMSRQWSAVALREENGLFGLDFYYKKRFK